MHPRMQAALRDPATLIVPLFRDEAHPTIQPVLDQLYDDLIALATKAVLEDFGVPEDDSVDELIDEAALGLVDRLKLRFINGAWPK